MQTIKSNPLSIFRWAFALFFVQMNLSLLFDYKFLFGSESPPKQAFLGYYQNSVLNSIFQLNDFFFVAAMGFSLFAGIYFAIGKHKKWAIFLCWLFMAFIFIRIPVARSIHIPFLGFMMLLNLFIPDPVRAKQFQILDGDFAPLDVRNAAFIIIIFNYFAATIYKLSTVEWLSGQALFFVFQDIIPRQNQLTQFILSQQWIATLMTYSVLLIEGLLFLLVFKKSMRFVFVVVSALMHVGIFIFFRIGELSSGMLLFHVFLLAVNFEDEKGPIKCK